MDSHRYARQIMLPCIGSEGQQRLLSSSALIVGVGGLGSPVALYLAGAGVGTLHLADSDTVSISNLQRQILYRQQQQGLPKVDMAAECLAALNSDVLTVLHPEGLTPDNAPELIAQVDIVIDCCDNYATRYLIDDVCCELGKTWVHGSIGEFAGCVAVFGRRCRYSDAFADRDELCALPRAAAGVLGPVPGVIGSIQACEALKILAGLPTALDGKIMAIDLMTMNTETIKL